MPLKNQTDGTRDSPLFGHISSINCLNSRNGFIRNVKPSYFPAKVVQCKEWQMRSKDQSCLGEESAKGYDSPMTMLKLNRFHMRAVNIYMIHLQQRTEEEMGIFQWRHNTAGYEIVTF